MNTIISLTAALLLLVSPLLPATANKAKTEAGKVKVFMLSTGPVTVGEDITNVSEYFLQDGTQVVHYDYADGNWAEVA